MIKQKWSVTFGEEKHDVTYECTPVTGRVALCVDGSTFVVKGKPFGIGLVRREVVIVGGAQGLLDIQKGGRAKLTVRDGEVEEL